MRPNASLVLAIFASVAIAVPISLVLRQAPEPTPPFPQITPSVTQQLTSLAKRVERLEQAAATLHTSERIERAPIASPTPDTAVVAALEQRLAQVERHSPANPGHTLMRQALDRQQPNATTAAEAQRVLADAAASVDDKVEAHQRLRRVANAYTPAMVQDLVRIAETDPRPVARANVWTWFDGATLLPELVRPLLRALAHDPDGAVRAEAAETLGNYLDNPAVLPALRQAAQDDADEPVRAKAQRTLTQLGPRVDASK